MDLSAFTARLRQARYDLGLSVREFAAKCDLSSTALLAYESGAQQPQASSLVKLADFLNVSIDYLMGRTDLRRLPTSLDLACLEKTIFSAGQYVYSLKNDLTERDGDSV